MTIKMGTLLAAVGLACTAATWTGCSEDEDPACTGTDCETGTQKPGATRGDSGFGNPPSTRDGAIVGSDSGSPPANEPPRDAGGTTSGDGGSEPTQPGDPGPGADAATPTDAGGTMEEPVKPPPGGVQLSQCRKPADCTKELGCYVAEPGPGYCTVKCDSDEDCAGLMGAEYTCSPERGLCKIDCRRAPPSAAMCPDGLACMQVGEPEGQLGCRYPPAPVREPDMDGRAFSACDAAEDCNEGMECTAAGYCSPACNRAAECRRPRTGTIMPSCEDETCVLSCADAPEGCPQGMTCSDMRCVFP